MTKKAVTQVMENLYSVDACSYDELYHAIQVLSNLGLVDDSLRKAIIKKAQELFDRGCNQ